MMFYRASGLEANPAKCEVFYASISEYKELEICEFLNMEVGSLHFKHLGVPFTLNRPITH